MVATGVRLLPLVFQCVQAANEGVGGGAAEAELAAYSCTEQQTVVKAKPCEC